MRSWWPVLAVLAFELVALAVLPRQSAGARSSGAQITLRTLAVDPYDPLAGRFVILRYVVEEDFHERTFEVDQPVWIQVGRSHPAWERVDVTEDPGPQGAARRFLRAIWRGQGPELVGAGRLYLPEQECLEADRLLLEFPGEGLVDLAVDEEGNVSPLRLHIADRRFGTP